MGPSKANQSGAQKAGSLSQDVVVCFAPCSQNAVVLAILKAIAVIHSHYRQTGLQLGLKFLIFGAQEATWSPELIRNKLR